MHENQPINESSGVGQATDPARGQPTSPNPAEGWVRRPVGDFDPRHKSPRVAVFLSMIFPGLGQLYIGMYTRGVMLAGTIFLLIAMVNAVGDDVAVAFVWGIAFTWMFSMIDAGRMAALYNYAIAGGEEIAMPQDVRLPRVGGSIAAGTVLVIFGSIALSHTLFDRPLDWLENWWPALPLAIGLYLLARGIMDHLNIESGHGELPSESLRDDLTSGIVE